MKTRICRLIPLIGLLTACLILIGPRVLANQGHHQSGIVGQVVGLPNFIQECRIRIVSSDGGKLDVDIVTDADLTFAISLKPGVYTLVPYVVNAPPLFIPSGSPVVVRVEKKNIVAMTLPYIPEPQ
jgi:hypothetical protein